MGSKGKGGRLRFQPGGAGGGSNPNLMLKQVQQLQAQMQQVQEELGQETVSASVGGGAVTVVMNGHQEVHSLSINPDAVHPEEVEMLQDLIVAAMNEALKKSRDLAEKKMAPLTGALSLPGLM
jgi:DNA-binding YbaB/EbfC family protein